MKKLLSAFLSFALFFNPGNSLVSQEIRDPFTNEPVSLEKFLGKESDEEVEKHKQTLLKKGLSLRAVRRIPRDFLKEYDLLKGEQVDVLERVSFIHDLFPGEAKPVWLYEYADSLKESDESTLVNLRKLKTLNPDNFSINHLGEYIRFLKRGVDVHALSRLSSDEIYLCDRQFSIYQPPKEIFRRCTPNSSLESIGISERVDGFSRGVIYARNYIKTIVSKKEHSKPIDVKHSEDVLQIDSINDSHILFLVKGYVDYFSEFRNVRNLERLFIPTKKGFKVERVAVVIDSEKSYSLLPLDMDDVSSEYPFRGLASEVHVLPPLIVRYTKKVGILHTHPFLEFYKDKLNTTPSGDMEHYSPNSDSGSLCFSNLVNPYIVDCLVSEMKDRRYNIDLFFRDVVIKNGKPVNVSKVTVIDIGVY